MVHPRYTEEGLLTTLAHMATLQSPSRAFQDWGAPAFSGLPGPAVDLVHETHEQRYVPPIVQTPQEFWVSCSDTTALSISL